MTNTSHAIFNEDARRALALASFSADEDVAIDRPTVDALRNLFANDEFRMIAQLVTGLDELASYVEPSLNDAKRWIQLFGIARVVYERFEQTAKRQSR